MCELIRWGYTSESSPAHVAVCIFHSPLVYRIFTLTTEFLKRGWQYPVNIECWFCAKSSLWVSSSAKTYLMTPGFGSRLTNFSNLWEGYGFGRADYNSSLKMYNTNCMCLSFYDHMWWYDSVCHIFGVLLRMVFSEFSWTWTLIQPSAPPDETLCLWGTSQLCSTCICTLGSRLALVKLRLFIFLSFIYFSVQACR